MKTRRTIITGVVLAIFVLVQSCADQKRAAEDRADRMNETTREARENPENRPDEPVPISRTTGENLINDENQFNQEGKNELNEVAKQAVMKGKKLVGGATMDPQASILDNISRAANLSTFVKAINTANLTTILDKDGPFTILAPVNAAFDELSSDELENLLKPNNKMALQQLLKNHILTGDKGVADITEVINQNNGEASLETLGEQSLTARLEGEQVIIEDTQGNTARLMTSDVKQSNGRMHVINRVFTSGAR